MALTAEQRQDIARAYMAGKRCKVIAREFGLDPSRVSEIARSTGAPRRNLGYGDSRIFTGFELMVLGKIIAASPSPVALSEFGQNVVSFRTKLKRLRGKLPPPAKILSARGVGVMVLPDHAALIKPLLEEV